MQHYDSLNTVCDSIAEIEIISKFFRDDIFCSSQGYLDIDKLGFLTRNLLSAIDTLNKDFNELWKECGGASLR